MRLAAGAPAALRASRAARADAREWTRDLAGDAAPGAGGLLTADIGATIVTSCSQKEQAAPRSGRLIRWRRWPTGRRHAPPLAGTRPGPQEDQESEHHRWPDLGSR